MNDGQVKQIVDAIREHTRAIVAAMAYERESSIKARDDQRGRIGAAINQADALLAALSESKPTTRDDLRETALRSTERINADLLNDRRAELSASSGGDGQSESQVANATPGREPGQGSKEAATPPLPTDLVTVRRDDLEWAIGVASLDHFTFDVDERACRIREAVSR